VNASAGDPVQQVKDLTGGGVEYSFEAIGLKQTAEQAFYMLAKGGTATVIGMIPVGTKIELHGPDFLQEKKIQGSSMGSNRFRVDMPRYVEMYLNGKLKLDEMITREITLEQINEAFTALLGGEVARQVIRFAS
jgi:S-(hydroxymethyl)glutathione dehydrogenase/alcohol dehydrogenase